MELFGIEHFYDARKRPLTAPSRAIRRRANLPAHTHRHGSYAHCHPNSHIPHKHVIEDAELCRPEDLALIVEPPAARRRHLAQSA
jgi:hypothetical protein